MPSQEAKLRAPSTSASVRSRRWFRSQRTPSAMSARSERFSPATFAPAGRNEPAMLATSRAATRNEALSSQNGTEAATANRMPPIGGPTNVLVTTSPAYRRPLASSSWWVATIDGMIDWAALSKSVSQVPREKATT